MGLNSSERRAMKAYYNRWRNKRIKCWHLVNERPIKDMGSIGQKISSSMADTATHGTLRINEAILNGFKMISP